MAKVMVSLPDEALAYLDAEQMYGGITRCRGNIAELGKANRPKWPKD